MTRPFAYVFAIAFVFSSSMLDAQDAVLEVVEVVEVGEDVAEDAVVEVIAADGDILFEDEGIIEQAVGGFFEMIGNGFAGGGRLQKPAKEIYTKDVDKIESEEELEKLEAALAEDPSLQGMMPHYQMQSKSKCNAELRLIHLVCNLTRTEFTEIEKDARLASKRSLLRICQNQGRMMNGHAVQAKKGSKEPTPNERMENSLMQTVKRVLDEERSKQYQAELESRRQFRKQAMVEMLTSSIDTLVILSEEQRLKVEKLFREQWKSEWSNCAQYLTNSQIRYVPGIPKKAISEFLTDEQKTVFKAVRWQPQNGQHYFNGFDMFGFGNNQQGELKNELEFAPEAKDLAEGKTE